MALDKVSDVFSFILFAALLSTAVSATLGTLGLLAGGEITISHAGTTWLVWWLGDGMGVLVISPFFLIAKPRLTHAFPTSASFTKTLEALTLVISLTLIGQAILGNPEVGR